MSIMAKTPSGYKKIGSAYLGERPVDKVYNANGDVVYALQRELTGVPPLLFKGKEQSELLNYRIYGDTVDGNGVGDLVESGEHAGEYKVPVTVEGKNLFDENAEVTNKYVRPNGEETVGSNGDMFNVNKIAVKPDTTYTFSWQRIVSGTNNYQPYIRVSSYDSNNNFLVCDLLQTNNYPNKVCSITTSNSTAFLDIRVDDISSERGQGLEGLMLNEGSTALPYEPYHAPVTTPIYLPEPIKMVGDEAEYIDYREQKLHRVRKNLFDITAQHTIAYGTCYKYIISGLNPNLNYTCSTNYNQEKHEDASVYFCGSLTWQNGVWQNEPKTYKPNNNGEVIILIRFIQYQESLPIYDAVVSGDIWIMVNEGDSPLPYEPYIKNTDLDVTLPALPTLSGTNTMSADTEVQPSRMDIKGRIKSLT